MPEAPSGPGRGPGRRPGAPDTRGEILAAARSSFAANGFTATTIRGVARAAGVDPALVHHYFATKADLFAAAVDMPIEPDRIVARIMSGDPDRRGERMVRTFMAIWSDEDNRGRLLGVLRSAVTNEDAATMVRNGMTPLVLDAMAAELTAPDARLRVTAAVTHLLGLIVGRYVLRIDPLVTATEDELVALVAPTLQRYLDP